LNFGLKLVKIKNQIFMEIKKEKAKILKKIKETKSLKELDEVFKEAQNEIKNFTQKLKKLSLKQRKKFGKEINELKEKLEKEYRAKKQVLQEKTKEKKEFFDVTAPGKKIELGSFHPITLVKNRAEEIFQSLGFEIILGPEIEDEWHNFDALNIPPDHPARDVLSLGKTFYLEEKKLMRSHTSSVQIRYMEKNNPPLKIVAPGKVFRKDAIDATHEIEFWQLEGLMVDKKISVANFKAIMEEFLKKFFEKEMKIRLRPSYFPFTEPSFEVDISCVICGGKGCQTCKETGWIEAGGAGMVHPQVFRNCKIDPKEWQGFAFGMGLTRLTMLKYKIPDIRYFHSGDLRFLKQF
jgi:phenylalanyl-tRNA synthetase alpha chain